MTLRSRLLISFGLLSALTLVLINLLRTFGMPFTTYSGAYGEETSLILRHLNLVADLEKKRFSFWLEERKGDLNTVARNPTILANFPRLRTEVGLDMGRRGEELRTAVMKHEAYGLIFDRLKYISASHEVFKKLQLVDAVSGLILASTDTAEVGADASTEDYFHRAKDLPLDMSVTVKDSPLEVKSSTIISGLTSNEDGASAVIAMFLDSASLMGSMVSAGEALGDTGEVLLLDRRGRVLTPLKQPLAGGSDAKISGTLMSSGPAPAPSIGVESMDGFGGKDYRGVSVLMVSREIDVNREMSWKILVKIDQAEVFAPLWGRVRQTLVLSLVGLLGVGLLAVCMARGVSQPLESLRRAAEDVKSGDLGVRALVSGPKEVESLAASFNSMIEEFQKLHQGLSQQVETAKDQLTKLNHALAVERTEGEKMEAELTSQKQLAQAMLHAMGDGIITTDVGGKVMSLNSVAQELTGWTESEAVGRPLGKVFQLINGTTRQACANPVDQVLASEFVFGLAHPTALIARDGTEKAIVDGGAIIHDAHGKTVGVMFVFREKRRNQ